MSRERESNPQPLTLAPPATWYLLETNYDHWLQPPHDDDRRAWGLHYMVKTPPFACVSSF
jgi:hypothetical protein